MFGTQQKVCCSRGLCRVDIMKDVLLFCLTALWRRKALKKLRVSQRNISFLWHLMSHMLTHPLLHGIAWHFPFSQRSRHPARKKAGTDINRYIKQARTQLSPNNTETDSSVCEVDKRHSYLMVSNRQISQQQGLQRQLYIYESDFLYDSRARVCKTVTAKRSAL